MPAPTARVLRLDTWDGVGSARYINGFEPERLTLTLAFVVTVEVRAQGDVVITTAAGQVIVLQPESTTAEELSHRLEELITKAQR